MRFMSLDAPMNAPFKLPQPATILLTHPSKNDTRSTKGPNDDKADTLLPFLTKMTEWAKNVGEMFVYYGRCLFGKTMVGF